MTLAKAEWQRGVVREAAREIPILAEVDVVVAGGGMSGYAAAIAAARTGAQTIVLESSGFLGGLLTGCLGERGMYENDQDGLQIIAGVWEETKQRLIAMHASPGTLRFDGPFYGPTIKVPPSATHTPFDSEAFKFVVAEQVLEAGARILLHATIVGVVMEGSTVRGVLAEGKSGRFAVCGKVVVDCTGDVDVAFAAGAPCQKGRESDGRLMGSSLHFHVHGVQPGPLWEYVQTHPEDVPRWARLVPPPGTHISPHVQIMGFACHGFQQSLQAAKARGELYFTNGELGIQPLPGVGHVEVNVTKVDIDGTDVVGLTTAQIETRKQAVSIMQYLRKHIPGFQAAYISQTAPEIQCRETRRIVGEFVMRVEDMVDGTPFDDAVALGSYPVEVHVPETGQRQWQVTDRAYRIPYRAFHPRGVDNLIVGSARALSVTHEVGAALRVCPIPIATGQAAGLAAGLSAVRATQPRKLDAAELRERLRAQRAVVD